MNNLEAIRNELERANDLKSHEIVCLKTLAYKLSSQTRLLDNIVQYNERILDELLNIQRRRTFGEWIDHKISCYKARLHNWYYKTFCYKADPAATLRNYAISGKSGRFVGSRF